MNKTSFPRKDIKVLLLEGVSQTAVENFRQAGYTNIDYHEKSLPEAELSRAVSEAHMVGVRSRSHLTADVLNNARRLMAVGCFCIGTNQVDLEAAAKNGIAVFNAPYSNTRSVAELVIAESVLLMRGIPEKNMACHRGDWLKSASGSYELRGKTLGIVGYGHIGTQVGVLAEAMGMRVMYYDIEPKLAMGNAQAAASLGELLSVSDIVTLHVPQTPQTDWMIGAAELRRMKPGGLLINASRGTVVEIEPLAEAIKAGNLAGAAIDVHPVEPKGKGEDFVSPLIGLDNVLLTPHIGGSTQEAQHNIGVEVSSKLIRYSDNGSTLSSVNFPEVMLPEHPGSSRLLHIHANRPGVLKQVNNLCAQADLNVNAQYLRTRGEVGYVVIDVQANETQAQSLRGELEAIEGTLKTRLLY